MRSVWLVLLIACAATPTLSVSLDDDQQKWKEFVAKNEMP